MRDLLLSVDRELQFVRTTREPVNAPWFSALSERVLARDKGCCRSCGFTSRFGMECICLSGAESVADTGRAEDYACLCPPCSASVHLEIDAGDDAVVIYAPELTQGQVSILCHTFWRAQVMGGRPASIAGQVLSALTNRRRATEAMFGIETTSDHKEQRNSSRANVFAGMLIALPDELYATRADLICGFRLVPTRSAYSAQISAWSKESYSAPDVSEWDHLFKQYLPDVAKSLETADD